MQLEYGIEVKGLDAGTGIQILAAHGFCEI